MCPLHLKRRTFTKLSNLNIGSMIMLTQSALALKPVNLLNSMLASKCSKVQAICQLSLWIAITTICSCTCRQQQITPKQQSYKPNFARMLKTQINLVPICQLAVSSTSWLVSNHFRKLIRKQSEVSLKKVKRINITSCKSCIANFKTLSSLTLSL